MNKTTNQTSWEIPKGFVERIGKTKKELEEYKENENKEGEEDDEPKIKTIADEIDYRIKCAAGTKRLNFSNFNLSELPEFPPELGQLLYLYLCHNQLEKVPLTVWRLKYIQELNLSYNSLYDVTIYKGEAIAKQYGVLQLGVGNLQSLQLLDINHNKITDLPDDLTKLKRLTQLIASQYIIYIYIIVIQLIN